MGGLLSMSVDWHSLILSVEFQRQLRQLIGRKLRADPIAAEEAETFILERLAADDWKKLKSFKGRSSPKTYAFSACSSLLVDFIRRDEGRLRPPTWVVKKGNLYVDLWEAHCKNREPLELVVKKFGEDQNRDPAVVREALRQIRAIPSCGVKRGHVIMEPGDIDKHVYDTHANSDAGQFGPDPVEHDQHEKALERLNLILSSVDSESDKLEATSPVDQVPLTPDEKILLKLVFCEGKTEAFAAKAIGVPKKEAVRLLESVLARFRDLVLAQRRQ